MDRLACHSLGYGENGHLSACRLQFFYRSYLSLHAWKSVVRKIQIRARQTRLRMAIQADDDDVKEQFIHLLKTGFAASRLTSKGKWKNIHLKLALNISDEECHLTWQSSKSTSKSSSLSSRKELKKMDLVFIERVTTVQSHEMKSLWKMKKENWNTRKTLVFYSSNQSPEKFIVQVSSCDDRDLLLSGFSQFCTELQQIDAHIDENGILRRPLHKHAIKFFTQNNHEQVREYTRVQSGNPQEDCMERIVMVPETNTSMENDTIEDEKRMGKDSGNNSEQLAQMYTTRFDTYSSHEPLSPRHEALLAEEQQLNMLFQSSAHLNKV